MKKFLTSALVLALSLGAAQAQTSDKGQKERKEHKMRGGSFNKLNLTEDQKVKMQTLREQQKAEMETLKNNQSLSKEQLKTQRMELMKKYRAQYEAILTPAQKEEAKKMAAERKSQGKFKKGGKKGMKGKDALKNDLNLSADQQEKMKELHEEFQTKAKAIRNNADLTQDQKKSQMQDLMKTRKEKMKAFLTAEQLEKMESKRKIRGAKKVK